MTTPNAAGAAGAAGAGAGPPVSNPAGNNPSPSSSSLPPTAAAKKRTLETTTTSNSTSTTPASTISGLTPVVRDACLKAMRLFDEKESFDRFYLFTQSWHKGISQGTALALALLYARLFKAFSHRHIQSPQTTSTGTANAGSSSNAPRNEPNNNNNNNNSNPNNNNNKGGASAGTAASGNKAGSEARPSLAEKTSTLAISTWSEAAASGKPLPPVKKSVPSSDGAGGHLNMDDMSEVGKVYVQKNFESLSTNVELSPRVSTAMYRIVGDLASVHALLPKATTTTVAGSSISWTDWSVAAICVAAHDFVVASLHQPKLRKAWKVALHGTNTPAQERDMFFIFCEKTTEWMAGRLVRAVESYQDFVIVWSKSVLHDRIRSNQMKKEDPKRVYQYLDISQLEWEPAVPTASSSSSSSTALAVAPRETAATAYQAESRARATAWKLAVFYSLFVQQKQQQRIPSRRQRLIANAGAIAFIMGLQRLAQHEQQYLQFKEKKKKEQEKKAPDGEGEDKMDVDGEPKESEDDKSTFPAQSHPGLEVLLESANKECAFTRWACLDQLKIAQNLDVKEIYFAAFQLAKSVHTFSQSRLDEKEKKKQQNELKRKGEIDMSGLPMWLQQLHHRVGRNASSILWTLPSFSTVLVDSFSRTLRSEKIKVEAAFYFDETSLVINEHQIELLCSYLDRPMPNDKQADSRFTAVAGSTRADRIGMVDQPDLVENAIAKRRKTDEDADILKSASPAVISEAMELTEWTVALLYLEQVKPPSRLRQFFKAAGVPKDNPKGDWSHVVVPILNATILRLSQEGLMGKTSRKASVSVQTFAQGGEEGVGSVVLASNVGSGDHDKALCRALVAFYYHALESILKHETKRLDGKKDHPNLIFDPSFHRALLTCCTLCVVKAVGTTQKLRPSADIQSIKIYQALLVCDCCPYEFLKVSELFLESMASEELQEKKGRSPFLRVLPRILKQDFQRAETNIIESLVWAHDTKFSVNLPDLLEEFGDERNKEGAPSGVVWWPVRALNNALPEEDLDFADSISNKAPTPDLTGYDDYVQVNGIVEEVLRRAYHRIALICLQLDVPVGAPLAKHAWMCFRHLMRTRAMLFFDRHLDHWILCSLYGVAKKIKMDPEIKFTKIVDAYIAVRGGEMGDVTCQRIVRNIKIDDSGDGGTTWGDVISLYNKVFVPAMKDHLFESKAVEKAEKQVSSNRYPTN